mgnify:CR=1 FL=1
MFLSLEYFIIEEEVVLGLSANQSICPNSWTNTLCTKLLKLVASLDIVVELSLIWNLVVVLPDTVWDANPYHVSEYPSATIVLADELLFVIQTRVAVEFQLDIDWFIGVCHVLL